MSSPAFIRRVVDKLNLTQDPEFAPWLIEEEPGWFGRCSSCSIRSATCPRMVGGAGVRVRQPATDPARAR